MWQGLLAERFKLVAHRETREFQIYDLLVAKGGPKFREASITPGNDGSRTYSELKVDGGLQRMHYPHVTMAELAAEVSGELKKPVNDKTGLSGKYQIDIYWVPDEQASPDAGPTLMQAVRDQLGLQLESKKGPVEFLIVDHAERTPTDN